MSIERKIFHLLALAERGGTEEEASTAMAKALELAAKHNLSIDNIKAPNQDEPIIQSQEEGVARHKWHRDIYQALAGLYFCKYYYISGMSRTQHFVVGKPSNIAIVKFLVAYVIRTGEALAQEAVAEIPQGSRAVFLNNWRKGFGHRIAARAAKQKQDAIDGKLKEASTGTSLVVLPAYNEARKQIEGYLNGAGVKLRKVRQPINISNREAYLKGNVAGGSVNLNPNAINNKSTKQIGG